MAGVANTAEWRGRRRQFWRGRRSGGRGRTPGGRVSPAGDSPFGCVDMVGNVWEWTRSIWTKYPYRADDGRENIDSRGLRVLRGAAWFSHDSLARCSFRLRYRPAGCYSGVGFRAVVVPFSPGRVRDTVLLAAWQLPRPRLTPRRRWPRGAGQGSRGNCSSGHRGSRPVPS